LLQKPIEDPEGMTKIIVEALEKTGQRGIIGKGWGEIGNMPVTPDFVYLVSDCPHDWLFPQCAAVIHHGGAGTTAAGLKAACPTAIIPFFGDQPFWGERVSEKGVGPPPIPVSHVTLDKLISAIEFMLDPEVKRKAVELAREMENEDGVEGAVSAFHKHLQKHLPDMTHMEKIPSSQQHGFFHNFLSSRRHRFLPRFFHKLHIKFH
jgi:sterol 3beta-glucosyltransferase